MQVIQLLNNYDYCKGWLREGDVPPPTRTVEAIANL